MLSHDVEDNRGLSRVDALMNVERNQGFRSCFNFVPEGEYRVSRCIAAEIWTGRASKSACTASST